MRIEEQSIPPTNSSLDIQSTSASARKRFGQKWLRTKALLAGAGFAASALVGGHLYEAASRPEIPAGSLLQKDTIRVTDEGQNRLYAEAFTTILQRSFQQKTDPEFWQQLQGLKNEPFPLLNKQLEVLVTRGRDDKTGKVATWKTELRYNQDLPAITPHPVFDVTVSQGAKFTVDIKTIVGRGGKFVSEKGYLEQRDLDAIENDLIAHPPEKWEVDLKADDVTLTGSTRDAFGPQEAEIIVDGHLSTHDELFNPSLLRIVVPKPPIDAFDPSVLPIVVAKPPVGAIGDVVIDNGCHAAMTIGEVTQQPSSEVNDEIEEVLLARITRENLSDAAKAIINKRKIGEIASVANRAQIKNLTDLAGSK